MRNPQKIKADGFRVKEKIHSPSDITNVKDQVSFGVAPSPEAGGNLWVTVEGCEWGIW